MCSATPTKTSLTMKRAFAITIRRKATPSIMSLTTRNQHVLQTSATTTSLRSHWRLKSPGPLTKILTSSVTRIQRTRLFKLARRAVVDHLTSVKVILSHRKLSLNLRETLTKVGIRTLSKVASSVQTSRRTRVASALAVSHQALLTCSERTKWTTSVATTTAWSQHLRSCTDQRDPQQMPVTPKQERSTEIRQRLTATIRIKGMVLLCQLEPIGPTVDSPLSTSPRLLRARTKKVEMANVTGSTHSCSLASSAVATSMVRNQLMIRMLHETKWALQLIGKHLLPWPNP